MKQYTVSEVLELQNQRKQLEQRLAIHKQRANEKDKELQQLFAAEGVSSIEELSQLCSKMNEEMQIYASKEAETISKMKGCCDELDRLL